MAEHVEHWVAQASSQVDTDQWPQDAQERLNDYVGAVIEHRQIKWEHGGGMGGFAGLDEAISQHIDGEPSFSCLDFCGIEVAFHDGGGKESASTFSIDCARRQYGSNEEATAKEEACYARHKSVALRLPSKIVGLAVSVRALKGDRAKAVHQIAKIDQDLGKLL